MFDANLARHSYLVIHDGTSFEIGEDSNPPLGTKRGSEFGGGELVLALVGPAPSNSFEMYLSGPYSASFDETKGE